MDAFSYLSVLLSIVLGLGLTQLLAGFAGMMRARHRVVMYWPVPLQMGAVFLITVQVWWALFALRGTPHWTFVAFLVVLLQTVSVFLMAALITPDFSGGEKIDLRSVYFRERAWYFGAILFALIVSLAKNFVFTGGLPNRADLAGHAVFGALALAGLASRNDVAHKIVAPLSLAAYAAYIAFLFVRLP